MSNGKQPTKTNNTVLMSLATKSLSNIENSIDRLLEKKKTAIAEYCVQAGNLDLKINNIKSQLRNGLHKNVFQTGIT
jgi:hypothetical protein